MKRRSVIALLALDIDGVLTDGTVTCSADGAEWKSLHMHDVDAVFEARRHGLTVVVITGEDSEWVDFIVRRLEIEHTVRGAKDKLQALTSVAESLGVPLAAICYVGDADRDAAALAAVGLGLAPQNATPTAKQAADQVLVSPGGAGAVAEAVRRVLGFSGCLVPKLASRTTTASSEQAGTEVKRLFAEAVSVLERSMAELTAEVVEAAERICEALENGGKLLIFGNGGSAAEANHMAAELVGRFEAKRQGLAAISLAADNCVVTALANDFGQECVFEHQVQALGKPGDLIVAITTRGESPNVLRGARCAQSMGLGVIGLTGGDGGELARLVDIPLIVPSTSVARIQECHQVIIHVLCSLVERRFVGME